MSTYVSSWTKERKKKLRHNGNIKINYRHILKWWMYDTFYSSQRNKRSSCLFSTVQYHLCTAFPKLQCSMALFIEAFMHVSVYISCISITSPFYITIWIWMIYIMIFIIMIWGFTLQLCSCTVQFYWSWEEGIGLIQVWKNCLGN